jgi:hypothetical protein
MSKGAKNTVKQPRGRPKKVGTVVTIMDDKQVNIDMSKTKMLAKLDKLVNLKVAKRK